MGGGSGGSGGDGYGPKWKKLFSLTGLSRASDYGPLVCLVTTHQIPSNTV